MVQAQIEILNNKTAKIILDDVKILKSLSKLLSFKEPGFEFSAAFRNHYWNGINNLLTKKNEFPIGLVRKVCEFLEKEKIEYKVSDLRKAVEMAEPMDISKKLVMMKKLPRYYQIDAVKKAIEHERGIIKMATGSGKTLAAALITAAFGKPTNLYVVGLDLLSQFYNLFSEIFDEEIGYVGNGVCEIKRINIISLWTASRALGIKTKITEDDEEAKEKFDESNTAKIQKALKEAKIHIIDECHTTTTNSFKNLMKAINPERLYGMSGTPYRDDGTDILVEGYLGDVIVNIPASELIEKGFLIPPTIKFFQVPKEYIESKNYQEIYKEYIVENNYRNNLIISSTEKLVSAGYQTMVLYRTIAHGKKLFEMLQNKNIKCALLSGADKSDKRELVKEQLLANELDCVVISTIGDIGLDITSLSALVLASGGKSSVRTLQRIGRVIRTHPGKKDVKVVDFWDNALYLKNHSKKRKEIYEREPGFTVIMDKGIKI